MFAQSSPQGPQHPPDCCPSWCSPSTISRELKRNSSAKGYHHWRAQVLTICRAGRGGGQSYNLSPTAQARGTVFFCPKGDDIKTQAISPLYSAGAFLQNHNANSSAFAELFSEWVHGHVRLLIQNCLFTSGCRKTGKAAPSLSTSRLLQSSQTGIRNAANQSARCR